MQSHRAARERAEQSRERGAAAEAESGKRGGEGVELRRLGEERGGEKEVASDGADSQGGQRWAKSGSL